MSRTAKYKLVYAIVVVLSLAIAFWLVIVLRHEMAWLLVIGLALLAPGRIAGHYLKDLFRARRLLERKAYLEAIEASERFLGSIAAEPWRRHLIYLMFSVYTWNVEAMARNNLGAAYLMRGHLDEAAQHLNEAKALDEGYPIPYYNLAIIESVRGRIEEGERLFSDAAKRGFKSSATDHMLEAVSRAFAEVQGIPLKS